MGRRTRRNTPITVREIMSHTAGLRGGRRAAIRSKATSRNSPSVPWNSSRGTKYKYSPGPAVGGRIIEVVSGVAYPQFLQQRLLDPLGLKDTDVLAQCRTGIPPGLDP